MSKEWNQPLGEPESAPLRANPIGLRDHHASRRQICLDKEKGRIIIPLIIYLFPQNSWLLRSCLQRTAGTQLHRSAFLSLLSLMLWASRSLKLPSPLYAFLSATPANQSPGFLFLFSIFLLQAATWINSPPPGFSFKTSVVVLELPFACILK